MTELIQNTSDAALAWVRRHLLAILSIAAAVGFAEAELANVRTTLGEARRDLAALHRDFIEFRLGDGAVSKASLGEALARQRETDQRQDDELKFHRAQILSLLQGGRIEPWAEDAVGAGPRHDPPRERRR